MFWLLLLAALLVQGIFCGSTNSAVVVIGSLNADIIVPLERHPISGETVVAKDSAELGPAGKTVAGGKGANQAVCAQRIGGISTLSRFCCKFGNDGNAEMLRKKLMAEGLDLSSCRQTDFPSGTGLILLVDGASTCIVCSGSNSEWDIAELQRDILPALLQPEGSSSRAKVVMLQCEVPVAVNEAVAVAAQALGIPVFQDVGGEERDMSQDHLRHCAFVSPNLSELRRLTKMPCETDEQVLAAARHLQERGARNVLVTLGDQGCLLLVEGGTQVIKQAPISLAECGLNVVDETGAGDHFRAAFCVAHFMEGRELSDSLSFASAAAAVSVTRLGAMACCDRAECDSLLELVAKAKTQTKTHRNGDDDGDGGGGGGGGGGEDRNKNSKIFSLSGGGWFGGKPSSSSSSSSPPSVTVNVEEMTEADCPFEFASRLNSMHARLELFEDAPFGLVPGGKPVNGVAAGVRAWVRRQGKIRGLSLVDFNFPQHLTAPVSPEAKAEVLSCLSAAKLRCGAVCLRFPKDMQLGALTHPVSAVRERAMELVSQACDWAVALGSSEVIVWSAFDGYDYPLQADYDTMWKDVVTAFQRVCDRHKQVRISLEYKPTDENTRFFAVPSTGAAVLLERQVQRKNFGLTLDFGHCLMAGENPAQAVSMVAQGCSAPGKLFGVQLGDGHSRLGAEDGLAFGSVHRLSALEFVYQLCKVGYSGHIYFDTFPRNEDPVSEAQYNIQTFRKLWVVARRMLGRDRARVEDMQRRHDAMGMLEYLRGEGAM